MAVIAAASHALASQVAAAERESGLLLPAIDRLRDVSRAVGVAVAECAVREGVARVEGTDIAARAEASM